MKYIKIYEKWTPTKYQIGDYFEIETNWLDSIVEIIKVLPEHYNIETEYKIQAYNRWDNESEILSFTEDELDLIIIRKLTPEEIDVIKLKQDSNKYNL